VADDRAGELAALLARHGFVAAAEEAEELLAAAGGDPGQLDALVARRLTGEPLAWITGGVEFCGRWLRVDPGVYVPRPHTEELAARAVDRLPAAGLAVDLCTGSGALAATLAAERPAATVVATDLSEEAVACARANGVDARLGDLLDPVPADLHHAVDVITAVVPYVPTPDLPLLQRDTFAFETPLAYDGGAAGLDVLRRVAAESPRWLRPGGALLLELGGKQAEVLAPILAAAGFPEPEVLRDEEGDVRGVAAAFAPSG
jgi:release factor glutamine methyltransferase